MFGVGTAPPATPPLRVRSLKPMSSTRITRMFGGEPALFGVLRPARFCFPVEAIALGGNAGRKLWHELACRGPLDQAPQVGDRAAHPLGLQPAGEFVEERLGLVGHLAQQPLGCVSLLGQQPIREDQCFTTTHGRRERWLPGRR